MTYTDIKEKIGNAKVLLLYAYANEKQELCYDITLGYEEDDKHYCKKHVMVLLTNDRERSIFDDILKCVNPDNVKVYKEGELL